MGPTSATELQAGLGPPVPGLRARWAGALVLLVACVTLTQLTHYQLHDPDSRLYAALSAHLAERPLAEWIAPQWQGEWNRQGPFREHPPGLLWLGAGLVRLGLDGEGAVCAVNFACLLLELLLLYQLGGALGGPLLGLGAALIWALNPSFVQYLVRGNQEHPMALAVVAALLALAGLRSAAARLLVWTLALGLAVWVKGLSGLALLPMAGAYWLLHERTARLAGLLAGGVLVVLASLVLFEVAHGRATGESFWQTYLTDQIQRSVGAGSGHAPFVAGSTLGAIGLTLSHKARNLVYYLVRPLWYFFPWMLLAWWGLAQQLRRRQQAPRRSDVAWSMGVATAAIFVLGFSLADRKADRYVFPCYPALALAVAWWILERRSGLAGRLQAALSRRRAVLPLLLAVALLGAVAGRLYLGTYHYRFIHFWPGSEDHLVR